MKTPHPSFLGSVRLAPAWHQASSRITRGSSHEHNLFSGGTAVAKPTYSPLIAYQRRHSNPLYPRIFSFVVPTWCHA